MHDEVWLMKTVSLILWTLCLLAACSGNGKKGEEVNTLSKATDSTGRVFALVIGVSEYDDQNIEELDFAHKDADAFTNFLVEQVGDHGAAAIRLLKNKHASRAKILTQIDWLYQNAKKGDQVYFYFSGHGMSQGEKSVHTGAYLCTHDTYRALLSDGGLEMERVVNLLNKIVTDRKAKVYFIADACRAGLAQKSYSAHLVETASATGNSSEMVRFLSCGQNQESLEGEKWGGGRGLFSYYLELGLSGAADKDKDEAITVHELEMYLKQMVPQESQKEGGLQIPEVFGNKTNSIQTYAGASKIKGPPMDCEADITTQIHKMIADYVNSSDVKNPSEFFDLELTKLTQDVDTSQNCNPELVLLEAIRADNDQLFHKYTTGKVINTGSNRFLKAAKLAKYAIGKYKQRPTAPILLELLREHHNFFLARSYAKRKSSDQNDLALHYLDELKSDHPACSTYVNHLYGITYHTKGDMDKAKYYYQTAIKINPNWVFPMVNLASIYHSEGDTKKALELLNSAIAVDSRFASSYYMKGLLFQENQKLTDAEREYRKALELDPQHFGTANNLGRILEKKGLNEHHDEIINLYKQAVGAEPNFLGAWCNLGRIYIKTGQENKAISTLKQALNHEHYEGDVEMQASKASVYDYLAYAYEKKGDLEGATPYLLKSLQLSNGTPEAYTFLLINLLEQKKTIRALTTYEEGLVKHQDVNFLKNWAKQSNELKMFLKSTEVKKINSRVMAMGK